jgi:hypothetical protein
VADIDHRDLLIKTLASIRRRKPSWARGRLQLRARLGENGPLLMRQLFTDDEWRELERLVEQSPEVARG